ncbi:MAG: polysaccharide biosynthesis/export family protein [Candidatus Omnitrophota bacterium]
MSKKERLCNILLFLLIVSVCLGSAGCSRFQKPSKPLDYSLYNPETAVSGTGEYVIGVRDTLEIAVWRCPELDSTVTVRPEDGKITIPLVGEVKAKGLTPRELALEISRKIAYYVKEPRIAVGVSKIGDKKVFLLGEVGKNGSFRLERGDRIIDLITRAGGFTEDAVPSCTHIVRGGFDDSKIIRVNLARLIHKADISQNIYLEEGDIVYVPETEIEQLNYALKKTFPTFFFGTKLADMQQDIMQGKYDWSSVWLKMRGGHDK